jgi:hypothetical protein
LEGFTAPWSRLAELVTDLRVDERFGGAGYVTSALCRRDAQA